MNQEQYISETKMYFSNLIRSILGEEPRSILITDRNEINKILCDISRKINSDKERMSYLWWWRYGNNSLDKFEMDGDYLYLNGWRLRIKELYINISPISIFDFIIFRVIGENNDIPDIANYKFYNSGVNIDLNKATLLDFSIQNSLANGITEFSQPYNFILSAQFGLPNLNIYSDENFEFMLNKLLFNKISYEDFTDWYSGILTPLKKKVEEFYKYIVEFPMLALNHEFGKKIYESIKNIDRYKISDKTFYRARAFEKNSSYSPYDEENMWNAPCDKVPIYEGRYNHFGQSFLYMAADEETAFKEVVPKWHSSCSMIKIKLQSFIKVLDLRKVNFYKEKEFSVEYMFLHYMLVHEGTISQETKNPYIKPEYVVPRFLADCARAHNFQGILFNSTKNKGVNIVLFEPELLKKEGKVITEEKPYIYNRK